MKLLLFVEGETEEIILPPFFGRWADRVYATRLRVQPIRFRGCGDFLKSIGNRARQELTNAQPSVGLGLLDLHAPDCLTAGGSIREHYYAEKTRIERRVDHDHFRQHFAVHEIEAGMIAALHVREDPIAEKIGRKAAEPESINFDKIPSRQLERAFRDVKDVNYAPQRHARTLLGEALPDEIARICPYLQLLLADLAALLDDAGVPRRT